MTKKKALLKKMKQEEVTRKRGFPWRATFFFLLFVIGSVLLVDFQKHGSIKQMRTNIMIRNSKVVEYTQNGWSYIANYTQMGLDSIEKKFPEQYSYVMEQSKSYAKLAGDSAIIVKNFAFKIYGNISSYVTEKKPLVEEFIESYAPGFLNQMQEHSKNGFELVKTYYVKLGEQVIEHSTMMIRWMEVNVFVGKLSPESLQNYASKAINSTQTLASQTYDWVYEKVQTFSKEH